MAGLRLIAMMATVLSLGKPASAIEMYLGPQEAVCARSDLIVVGTFVDAIPISASEVSTLEALIKPCQWQQMNCTLKRCSFETISVIKGDKSLKTITAVAYVSMGDKVIQCAAMFPPLELGKQYLLILNRLGDKEEYYVSPRSELTSAATAQRVSDVKCAANPDCWNWGIPVKGLSLALRLDHYPADGGGLGAHAVLAVRNSSSNEVILHFGKSGKAFVAAQDDDGHPIPPESHGYTDVVIQQRTSPASQPTTRDTLETPFSVMEGCLSVVLPPESVVLIRDDFFALKTVRGSFQGTLEIADAISTAWSGAITTPLVRVVGELSIAGGQPAAANTVAFRHEAVLWVYKSGEQIAPFGPILGGDRTLVPDHNDILDVRPGDGCIFVTEGQVGGQDPFTPQASLKMTQALDLRTGQPVSPRGSPREVELPKPICRGDRGRWETPVGEDLSVYSAGETGCLYLRVPSEILMLRMKYPDPEVTYQPWLGVPMAAFRMPDNLLIVGLSQGYVVCIDLKELLSPSSQR